LIQKAMTSIGPAELKHDPPFCHLVAKARRPILPLDQAILNYKHQELIKQYQFN
jgi:hypothetical protein